MKKYKKKANRSIIRIQLNKPTTSNIPCNSVANHDELKNILITCVQSLHGRDFTKHPPITDVSSLVKL